MKINHYILAFTLLFAGSYALPAQAAWSSLFTAPLYSAASYLWSFCPITKAGLAEFEKKEKLETTQAADALIARENQSKQEINAKFTAINKRQDTLAENATLMQGTAISLNEQTRKLKTQLEEIKQNHETELPKVKKTLEEMLLELGLITFARATLMEKIQRLGEMTIDLDQKVGLMDAEMREINSNIETYKKQSLARDERISRIKEMLQPKKNGFANTMLSSVNYNIHSNSSDMQVRETKI
ncbi:MAG: hypothetical protein AB7F19_01105 [Candidatus Babeliales bacterium]